MLAYLDEDVDEAVRVEAAELIRLESCRMTPPAKLAILEAKLVRDACAYEALQSSMRRVAAQQRHPSEGSPSPFAVSPNKRPRDTAPVDYEALASSAAMQEVLLEVGNRCGSSLRQARWEAVHDGLRQLLSRVRGERVQVLRAVTAVNAHRKADQAAWAAAMGSVRAKAARVEQRLAALRSAPQQ